MYPKFRRQRIGRLEPATLIELKQYIDSRLVPPDVEPEAMSCEEAAPLPPSSRRLTHLEI